MAFPFHEQYTAALQQFKNGLYEESLATLRECLKNRDEPIASSDAGPLVKTVLAHTQDCLRPGYPELWNRVGVVLQRLGQFDEALSAYGRAIEAQEPPPSPLSSPTISWKPVAAQNLKVLKDQLASAERRRMLNVGKEAFAQSMGEIAAKGLWELGKQVFTDEDG
jgi:tetratricopeptide (TPR) repeat protein